MRPAQNYARQDSYDDRSAYVPTLSNTPRANGSSRPPPNYIPSRHNAAPTRYSTRQAPIHRGATIRQQQAHQGPPSSSIPTYQNQGAPGLTSSTTLKRGKTLTRPDRHVAPAPLINPTQVAGPSFSNAPILAKQEKKSWFQPWAAFVTCSTFWAPAFVLDACGVKGKLVQRAWKEKVSLCIIALVMGGVVAFFTIGLNRTLCPASSASSPEEIITAGQQAGYVGIVGWMFLANQSQPANDIDLKTYAAQYSGVDVSYFFDRSGNAAFPQCAGISAPYATVNLCTNSSSALSADCVFSAPVDSTFTRLNVFNSTKSVGWSWHDVANAQNHLAIDGSVLNLTPYLLAHPNGVSGDEVDTAIRQVLLTQDPQYGKDATRLFHNRKVLQDALPCLRARYNAGKIDKTTPGCFAAQLFLYVSLVVILGIILVRFAMACVFSWFLSRRLVQPPKNLRRQVVSPAVMPEGANIEYNNKTGTAPWTKPEAKGKSAKSPLMNEKSSPRHLAPPGQSEKKAVSPVDSDGMISMAAIGAELFCVCLVTCYSEGEESIRSTLDSIAGTTYSDARKLLFVVCDGIVTGSGEKRSTPDICVGLVERDERFGLEEPQRMSYGAVGSGSKAHNEALVYAGHYTVVPGHRTPIVVVVKVGGPEEAHEKKPGNRGKRDGQMILMNFFGRVTYNDRMCPLDYDLFRKTHALMGVTPDFFEVCLMVDADTKVYPESLTALVNCMQHDDYIMGVCGETRIANKRQSWVTAIQVFEYFISHHLAKAFESVFGGVTCLPGCFSMYRIKARKANDSDWVPVLVQSEITKEYSQSDVQTLHQKNLLLLGEDRFLTTCLLRTFPNRKMMFCPQARCRTIAPDDFKTLLSQRRRWINSTIHNLMELVRVRNLCGTFCFSMQFIVFMELVGTVVLPVAICLTYSLVINYIINPPQNFADAIPLLLLAGVLGLPGVLILITTFKVVYLLWLLVYLVALPIWNFVLPVYAYWHFDDFSWGETRKVEGELKDLGHIGGTGTVEVNAVPFRRWDDWERSRLRKARRDQKRKKEFERAFGTQQHYPTESGRNSARNSAWDAETASLATSGEDDRYGYQIGQYHEDAASHVPPPVGLYATDDASSVTMKSDQMVAMLEEEWNESDEEDNSREIMGQAVHYTQVQPDYVKTPPPGPRQIYNLSDNGTQSTYFADSNQNLAGTNPYPSNLSAHSSVSFEEHAPLATGVETGYTHARNRSSGSPPNHHPQYQAR